MGLALEIDRRALSRMAPDLRIVHVRLELWGRFVRERIPNAWPEMTILAQLIIEGPGASQGTARAPEMPEAIAETDRAVAHLVGIDRRVIRMYYTTWCPREILSRRLHLQPRAFDAILNRARWRIAGFLAAI